MKDLTLILPEVFLAATLALVIAGEITYHGERVRLIFATTLIGLCAALVQTLITYEFDSAQVFGGALSVDGLSLFFKMLFIAAALLTTLAASQSKEIARERRTEFYALTVASALAMCLLASAADLLLAFLALQFMNVLFYFMSGFGKRSPASAEAAIKYMIFGAVSAALLLHGIAILFAATKSLNIYEMHKALVASPLSQPLLLVAFLLIFLSLSFQIASFPMYLWAPDVIEGAPTPVSGYLSLAGRAAGVALATRFFIVVFAQPADAEGQWKVLGELDWTGALAVISGVTMLLGALLALRQVGAKRLVACLVVAETGFLMMGLLVLDQVGVAATLYSLVVELFAIMGAFAVLNFLSEAVKSDRLKDLGGAFGKAVPECICLVLFLLCLVGVPPMPGFVGKFALIGSVVRHSRPLLALVAIASTAISTAAVARLSYSLIGSARLRTGTQFTTDVLQRAHLAFLAVPMILVGVFADAILRLAGRSLGFILW